jgi:hypothetical protein
MVTTAESDADASHTGVTSKPTAAAMRATKASSDPRKRCPAKKSGDGVVTASSDTAASLFLWMLVLFMLLCPYLVGATDGGVDGMGTERGQMGHFFRATFGDLVLAVL